MAQTILYIILIIFTLDYLFEQWLDYLNLKNLSTSPPEPLKDVYDSEKYKTSQQYKRANALLHFIQSTVMFVIVLLMLLFDGFAWIDQLSRSIIDHPVWTSLVFFGLLGLLGDILGTPFQVYDTFVIEQKYGFNKMTPGLFISDKLKSWLLGAVIGGGLLAVIVWFYQQTGEYFWLYAWILVSGFSLFMVMFYSTLIVPLFNKQTPLEEGPLREKIEQFSKKAGFQLTNVFVIDGSKRSTKSNAYFAGLGKKKRIVLFDTLINDLEQDELVAVLAHEIGHYKKQHIITSIITSIVQTGLMFFILSLFINNPSLSHALGAEQHSFHLALLAFGILYSPISTLLGIGTNILSRKHEYEADAFASNYSYGAELAKALKNLSRKNLSNLTPHPAYVFFHYSHPPLLERLKAMQQA